MGNFDEFLTDSRPEPDNPTGQSPTSDVTMQALDRMWEGINGMPGLVGDADEALRIVGWWLGNKARKLTTGEDGISYDQMPPRITSSEGLMGKTGRAMGIPNANLPTSEDYKKFTGFQRRKPTTAAGEAFDEGIGGDIAEGAPAALVGGVKKIVEKGVSRLVPEAAKTIVKYDAVPHAAGKGVKAGLQALGEDETTQNVGEIIAQMLSTGAVALKEMPNLSAATREEVNGAVDKLSQAASSRGVAFQRPTIQTLLADIEGEVRAMGINPKSHPQTMSSLRYLRQQARGSGPMDFTDFNQLREFTGDALRATEPGSPDWKRVRRITTILDRFSGDPPPGSFTGNPREAADLARQARDLQLRYDKISIVEKAFDRAKNAATGNQFNEDDALRDAFRQIANKDDLMKLFSPIERQAIRDTVRSGQSEKMLKWLGRWSLLSRGLRGVGLAYLGHTFAGKEGLAAAVAAPELAREATTAMTRRSALKARTMIRRGDNRDINMWPGVGPGIGMEGYYAGEPVRKHEVPDTIEQDNPFAEFVR